MFSSSTSIPNRNITGSTPRGKREQESEPSVAELLLQGAREAAAHAGGDPDMLKRARVTRRPLTARHVRIRAPGPPSLKRIREIQKGLDASQAVFAENHPDALLGTAHAVRR